MKTRIISLMLIAAALFFSVPAVAKGEKDTATFKVWGNCAECKVRIETGAKKGSASKAAWDEESKMIQVTYDPAKTTPDKIAQSIAGAGYDTDKYTASIESYQKLPKCCQYERKE